jgi:hypothetical protein
MVIAGGNGDVVVPYEAAAELLFSRPEGMANFDARSENHPKFVGKFPDFFDS